VHVILTEKHLISCLCLSTSHDKQSCICRYMRVWCRIIETGLEGTALNRFTFIALFCFQTWIPAGLPTHLVPLLLRLRFGFGWPLCAFINYIYLLTYLLTYCPTWCTTNKCSSFSGKQWGVNFLSYSVARMHRVVWITRQWDRLMPLVKM